MPTRRRGGKYATTALPLAIGSPQFLAANDLPLYPSSALPFEDDDMSSDDELWNSKEKAKSTTAICNSQQPFGSDATVYESARTLDTADISSCHEPNPDSSVFGNSSKAYDAQASFSDKLDHAPTSSKIPQTATQETLAWRRSVPDDESDGLFGGGFFGTIASRRSDALFADSDSLLVSGGRDIFGTGPQTLFPDSSTRSDNAPVQAVLDVPSLFSLTSGASATGDKLSGHVAVNVDVRAGSIGKDEEGLNQAERGRGIEGETDRGSDAASERAGAEKLGAQHVPSTMAEEAFKIRAEKFLPEALVEGQSLGHSLGRKGLFDEDIERPAAAATASTGHVDRERGGITHLTQADSVLGLGQAAARGRGDGARSLFDDEKEDAVMPMPTPQQRGPPRATASSDGDKGSKSVAGRGGRIRGLFEDDDDDFLSSLTAPASVVSAATLSLSSENARTSVAAVSASTTSGDSGRDGGRQASAVGSIGGARDAAASSGDKGMFGLAARGGKAHSLFDDDVDDGRNETERVDFSAATNGGLGGDLVQAAATAKAAATGRGTGDVLESRAGGTTTARVKSGGGGLFGDASDEGDLFAAAKPRALASSKPATVKTPASVQGGNKGSLFGDEADDELLLAAVPRAATATQSLTGRQAAAAPRTEAATADATVGRVNQEAPKAASAPNSALPAAASVASVSLFGPLGSVPSASDKEQGRGLSLPDLSPFTPASTTIQIITSSTGDVPVRAAAADISGGEAAAAHSGGDGGGSRDGGGRQRGLIGGVDLAGLAAAIRPPGQAKPTASNPSAPAHAVDPPAPQPNASIKAAAASLAAAAMASAAAKSSGAVREPADAGQRGEARAARMPRRWLACHSICTPRLHSPSAKPAPSRHCALLALTQPVTPTWTDVEGARRQGRTMLARSRPRRSRYAAR